MSTHTSRTVASLTTAALLTGAGVAAVTPAQAAAPTRTVTRATALPQTVGVAAPLIVHRSAGVCASAAIKAAPTAAVTKKKAKKRYRSRRS